ncbi:rhodanese-like domain-containing protein [Mycoplasmatota bacterium]|nr:rhodanese-like domain-containing protein [Mycoplasmatota bacterium]
MFWIETGHIPSAILLSLGTIEDDHEEVFDSFDQVIIVYCRSGNRSQAAMKTLNNLGYENVYDLGGITTDWPYDVE